MPRHRASASDDANATPARAPWPQTARSGLPRPSPSARPGPAKPTGTRDQALPIAPQTMDASETGHPSDPHHEPTAPPHRHTTPPQYPRQQTPTPRSPMLPSRRAIRTPTSLASLLAEARETDTPPPAPSHHAGRKTDPFPLNARCLPRIQHIPPIIPQVRGVGTL